MKKICVITATRAEYGLLYPVIKAINESSELTLQLVVSGTHLIPEFGMTKKEILNDGFVIDKEIEILLASDNSSSISKSMGIAIISFADYIKDDKPDLGIILGDRYEMLAFASVLLNEHIPIAHINGGEITEGALDECYRHCLTKMSTLHFANCERHKKRIIQMGEDPHYVYNVGDTCIDNILNEKLLTFNELNQDLPFLQKDKPIAIVTYHPVTTEKNSLEQFEEILKVIKKRNEYQYIFTKSNSDEGGRAINSRMEKFAIDKKNIHVVESLGMRRFLSVLKLSRMMLGNSSSGLYEAPVFKIPTINIGNRQKGRYMGETVINCQAEEKEILKAIDLAESEDFREKIKSSSSPFGNGTAAKQIVEKITRFLIEDTWNGRKKFWDLE